MASLLNVCTRITVFWLIVALVAIIMAAGHEYGWHWFTTIIMSGLLGFMLSHAAGLDGASPFN